MERWGQAEDDKSSLRDQLSSSNSVVAVLKERIRSLRQLNRVQNLGGILLGSGLGVAYSENTLSALGVVLVLVGAVLFLMGGHTKREDGET
jgi:hypothetical protein